MTKLMDGTTITLPSATRNLRVDGACLSRVSLTPFVAMLTIGPCTRVQAYTALIYCSRIDVAINRASTSWC